MLSASGRGSRLHTRTLVLAVASLVAAGVPLRPAQAYGRKIPVFARLYRTACSTCHTAAPKLNVLGEAFRLNGYRLPENSQLLKHEEPLKLGEDPWKELWPRAIYPGEIPGAVPLALRVETDLQAVRSPDTESSFSYRFPHEVYLLSAAELGERISVFLEGSWTRERGFTFVQAKALFNDVIPRLPKRSLNLWAGLQNPYLFTFADREIDRAARQPFLWQAFRFADTPLRSAGGSDVRSTDGFQLRAPQPSLELNGILARRFYYGVGLAQGTTDRSEDRDSHKDVYYKVRYKLGGLALDGTYDSLGGPASKGYGQLMERRSLILEHFGYFGREPSAAGVDDGHRNLGVAVRYLEGRLDAGGGYVWSRHDDPWGVGGKGTMRSAFGRAEYLFLPWVIGSLKTDRMHSAPAEALLARGYSRGEELQTRVLPGVVMLVRPNVRFALEGEYFVTHRARAQAQRARPHALWSRLDIAF